MAYGLVKTLDGIKMVGNALTFIIYKNYFGRDLLNDIVSFAKQNADGGAVSRLAKLNVRTAEDIAALTAEEQAELVQAAEGYKFDSEFVLNVVAALVATARYPEKPDVVEVITEIPPHWLADKEVIGELMEFLLLFITQKKGGTVAGNGGTFCGRG
jgi:hypothetical protein